MGSISKKYIFQKGLGKSQYVFVSKHKKAEPPHYRTILKNYKARLNELNLEQIGIHGLRHTHAVMLLEAGASIKYVAERLGHSNVEMTLNVYVHLTEKMKQDDMNKFVNHMGLG
ncbi:tyrosine-type recombinase/integrase [Listeria booriae]|uniref:tyrosine-type recombinase/integrase n=1 Tax=Listeria booriae TaxID=1552123 RepID=UPI001625FDDA|nr:tyrosine-type recombinase/integrase [Listeria booriae]MBC1650721.1 tyrosine-type recombinase/integrase [Listeria booriae]